jgi:hypothetical protein
MFSESEDEDWRNVFLITRKHIASVEPGQGPVLQSFVERARRLQILELQRRSHVPIVLIHNPEGLEVPEKCWVYNHENRAVELDITGLSSWSTEEGKRPEQKGENEPYESDKYSEFFAPPEISGAASIV